MALGGGTFIAQNKALPGTYINFVSAASSSAALADRGYAAMALPLSWGPCGEIMTVTAEDLTKHSTALFGRAYTHRELLYLRELFSGAKTAYLYRLGKNGQQAACSLGKAKYSGTLGNGLTLVVQQLEEGYGVETLLDGSRVDYQVVLSSQQLEDNDYITFTANADLMETAGMPLTGGSDGEATDEEYQQFLDLSESYTFNTLGCLSDDETVKRLFCQHTIRMREEVGVKVQCVVHRYTQADHEGIISVENDVSGDTWGLVCWVTGIAAGCEVNRSNTNRRYTGELDILVSYTQSELERLLNMGAFVLHRAGGDIRVLEDVNTLVTYGAGKSADFSLNQTVRVLDQAAMDIASLFSSRYLGVIPNNRGGRLSLWGDVVSHHRALEAAGAIADFSPDHVEVEQGETKRSVVVTDRITPVCAMSQLYMTIVVA